MASRRTRAPIPRKQPLQERAAVTVDAILIAVEQVLERHGLAGLTTNRVAEIAGVSIGTLYQYYPNKEALVRAVQERYLTQTLGAVRALIAAADDVPLVQLAEAIGRTLVGMRDAQRPIHRWLIELRTAAAFQDGFRAHMDALTADLAAFLAARSDVRFPDPAATAFLLAHAIEGLVQAVGVRGPTLDAAPIAAAAADMVRAYVTSRVV
jgi:AcrR family transcriptional regulator